MTSQRIAGTVFLSVNGERLALQGNVSVVPGVPMREAMKGPVAVNGYKEEVTVPSIEADLSFQGDFDLVQHASLDDGTVQAELANGQLFVLSQAWAAGEWGVDNGEGKISAKWEGRVGEFVTA